MFKKLIFRFIIITIITIITLYFIIKYSLDSDKLSYFKNLVGIEKKRIIKNYLYSNHVIKKLEEEIFLQDQTLNIFKNIDLTNLELNKKKSGSVIEVKEIEKEKKLFKNLSLKKYQLTSGFYSGINLVLPGSGYIDFYEGNIIILSGRGVLAYKKNIEDPKENFQQIKNNINEFIGIKQFNKHRWFSLKDLFIFNNKIFVSYTEEVKEDCWNLSVISGDMNYQNIELKKIFSQEKCVHSINNIDKQFNAHQSGGRIVSFDENHILLSIGEFRSRHLAQDKHSVNGKIIKINILDNDYEIISMGHRNSQGLYVDKESNIILETEHGPQGGDEINLIDIKKIGNSEIQNYGWPISSAGKFYETMGEDKVKELNKKYPLYKSHSEHGFLEPLYSFVPSIGISEIVKISKNKYVLSSLGGKSLYFFELNEQKKIINLEKEEVSERIRDLNFKDNKLFLFMENTASIGVIDLSKLE